MYTPPGTRKQSAGTALCALAAALTIIGLFNLVEELVIRRSAPASVAITVTSLFLGIALVLLLVGGGLFLLGRREEKLDELERQELMDELNRRLQSNAEEPGGRIRLIIEVVFLEEEESPALPEPSPAPSNPPHLM